jgi:hypothetical protein
MYKTDKNMQNAGIVVSSVGRRSFVSFFVCVPWAFGVVEFRSARHSIIESHGFAWKAPAISEKEIEVKYKKIKIKTSPEFLSETLASREKFKKSISSKPRVCRAAPKKKRLKLG